MVSRSHQKNLITSNRNNSTLEEIKTSRGTPQGQSQEFPSLPETGSKMSVTTVAHVGVRRQPCRASYVMRPHRVLHQQLVLTSVGSW